MTEPGREAASAAERADKGFVSRKESENNDWPIRRNGSTVCAIQQEESPMSISMCRFAERQYNADFRGTQVTPEIVEQLIAMADKPIAEFPGYADFCKILTLSNRHADGEILFPTLKALTVKREDALASGGILKTAYESRTPEELPVLVEWVEGVEPPPADYIHLILYSGEQMAKEDDPVDTDWAIVSIGAAVTIEVEPMRPITALRNALGVEEGGSGVAIDREAYRESAAFWSEHVMIRR